MSQDKVGIQEIWDGFDLHTDNQQRFGLPSRLIAKIFLFRIIFGGTAYSFAQDIDFRECKLNTDGWESIIEKFYRKYQGIHQWHTSIVAEATRTGSLEIPTGRDWKFEPTRNKFGELKFPVTTVKNYPVQGLEADLMMVARVSLFNRIQQSGKAESIKLISTVHDSIVADCAKEEVDWTVETIASVFRDVPKNFERLFKKEFNLPFRGEVSVGETWGDLQEIKGLKWE